MAEVLYGIAQEVLKNLGSTALNEIASAWGFKTQLNKLKQTMETIKYVGLDAEERQASSHAVHGLLERLTDVVYAADDLFDEFNTVAARKELMGGNKLTKEVRTFFSHSNQVALACKISRNVKKIREELDGIINDSIFPKFVPELPERGSVMSLRRDQTMSYVDQGGVVGRDGDKQAILEMFFASFSTEHERDHHEENPAVIPIVGMGGMGKTTLAQLIYEDPHVKEHFDLRLWVCVSDVFHIKVIIEKLLKSATNQETPNLEIDQLQSHWRKEVGDRKFLLVLDDVWNENREEWLELRGLLKIGKQGSTVLVTTRSKEVANIMGTVSPHVLQGLSDEKSWELFEKMAFKPGHAQQQWQIETGKEIVKKCASVPLAIRTLGSLLYGQEERKWLSIKDTSLAKIRGGLENQSNIMSILKLSYHHLWLPLKSCFAYCALFPKDYSFDKEMLKDLWIAEGFIDSTANDGKSQDEVAEEYFNNLLQRSFFQDVQQNYLGIIESCKMHDFMHDLAQEVAGVKCKVANLNEMDFEENILHLSLAYRLTSSWEIPNSMPDMKLLRTFLLPEQIHDGSSFRKSISQQLVTSFSCLRVLDLKNLGLVSLSSSIAKLVHLRYLNLSESLLEKLPDSITDIWNLQTLILFGCTKLRALPRDMRKLINLRSLDVQKCVRLTQMPSRLGGLTSLNKLPLFIVNNSCASKSRYKPSAKLSDLKNLNKLRGLLKIEMKCSSENFMSEAVEADLSSKHELSKLRIDFPEFSDLTDVDCNHDEDVLEGLKPPSNIRKLIILRYKGEKLPSWARMDKLCTILPNLVQIILYNCQWCQELPDFSQLCFLRLLKLYGMESVEYIESSVCGGVHSSRFFPSLEALWLWGMENVKGWSKEVKSSGGEDTESSSSCEEVGQQFPRLMEFSKLSVLLIDGCPKLRTLPQCPNVESLILVKTNENLSMIKIAVATPSSAPSSSSLIGSKLKKLTIDNSENLRSLPNHCLHQLSYLVFNGDDKLESTKRLGDVFATLSSSLRELVFFECKKLRSIARGLEHLTSLERLRLSGLGPCEESGDEDSSMPWKALNTNLRKLELDDLPELVGLPTGLQHLANIRVLWLRRMDNLKELPEWISCLSSLEFLKLERCPNLKSLPEAFRELTSLNELVIIRCPELTERCRAPNGSDWPKIRHIPLSIVKEY